VSLLISTRAPRHNGAEWLVFCGQVITITLPESDEERKLTIWIFPILQTGTADTEGFWWSVNGLIFSSQILLTLPPPHPSLFSQSHRDKKRFVDRRIDRFYKWPLFFPPTAHLPLTDNETRDSKVLYCSAAAYFSAREMVFRHDEPISPTFRNAPQLMLVLITHSCVSVSGRWGQVLVFTHRVPVKSNYSAASTFTASHWLFVEHYMDGLEFWRAFTSHEKRTCGKWFSRSRSTVKSAEAVDEYFVCIKSGRFLELWQRLKHFPNLWAIINVTSTLLLQGNKTHKIMSKTTTLLFRSKMVCLTPASDMFPELWRAETLPHCTQSYFYAAYSRICLRYGVRIDSMYL